MSLKKIGSRDSTAFELDGIAGRTAKILGDSHVPWGEPTASNIRLSPGRYRIDRTVADEIRVYSQSPYQKTGTYDTSLVYLEAHSSGSAVFFNGGGTVFITRLA